MRLKLVTPPASEPLDLQSEIKPHLRVDISDDDTYISGLLIAAREYVEEAARRALVTQTWRLSLDDWPDGDEIELPLPPLQSVTSIVYYDEAGDDTTWSTDEYDVDTDSEPGRVVLKDNYTWPGVTLRSMNPIQITFVAGYGDNASDVPQKWKQAILLLIGHWYENREPVVASGAVPKEIPLAVSSLIWLDRG